MSKNTFSAVRLDVRFLYLIFLSYLGALLAFSDVMGITPFSLAGFKFYGADFLIVLLIGLILAKGPLSITNTHIGLYLLLFMFFGLISMLQGYMAGFDIRDIVGDYRRIFFYSIAFGITWRLLEDPKNLDLLKRIPYYAVVPVIIFSTLRAWKGISWTPRFPEGDIRAVSYISATVLLWVFFDVVSRLVTLRNDRISTQLSAYFWLIVVGFTFLIANYRLLWIMPLAGSAGLFIILWQTGLLRRMRILRTGFYIGGAAMISILLLKYTQNEFYLLIEQKFIYNVLGFQFKDSIRYFIWGEAWRRFSSNWLFGVGLGDILEYSVINSGGNWYQRISTTHNIILEILYQTGVTGLLLFVIPHIRFIWYVLSNLHKVPLEWSRPALVVLMTVLSMFLLGNFQPYLTTPSVAVLYYALMGISARFIYWGGHTLLKMEHGYEAGPL